MNNTNNKIIEEQKITISNLETKIIRLQDQFNIAKQKHNEINFQLIQSNLSMQQTLIEYQKTIRNLRQDKDELQNDLGKSKSEISFISAQLEILKSDLVTKNDDIFALLKKIDKRFSKSKKPQSSSKSKNNFSPFSPFSQINDENKENSRRGAKEEVVFKMPLPLCKRKTQQNNHNQHRVPLSHSSSKKKTSSTSRTKSVDRSSIFDFPLADITPSYLSHSSFIDPLVSNPPDGKTVLQPHGKEIKVKEEKNETIMEIETFRSENQDENTSTSVQILLSANGRPKRNSKLVSYAEPSLNTKLRKKEDHHFDNV